MVDARVMKTLKINIECGETTCAKAPGEFCSFMGSMRFGTIPICSLFPSDRDTYTELRDQDGWVQRCQQCLELSK